MTRLKTPELPPDRPAHRAPVEPRHVVTIEAHTIDLVPLSERYGTPRRLFTIWFSANMTILGVALGALGVEAGLSVAWTTAAIAIGNATGTIFMAAHSAQGPQLGIPQMIQSRAQFGVRGAGIPLVMVVLTYLLYCAANGVLIQGPIKSLVPMGDDAALAAIAVVTLFVAFVGYELIHRIGAVLTFVSAALFLTAACLLISAHPVSTHGGFLYSAAPATPFNHAAFMVMMTQAAAWALSYGPYVADYSRYLPPSVPASKTFWYTALGCWLSSTLVMTFGAYFAEIAPDLIKDPGNAIASAFGPGRPIVELLIIIAIIQGNVMNLYSAYMSVVTIFSGLRGTRRVGRAQKLAVMATLMVIATFLSMLAEKNFNAYFADMLSAMIYLLVPWSAINLADYYVIRKGEYHIPDMFRVEGEYGAYRWKTIGVYFVGILVQTPFISLSFYQGAIAQHLGADIAWAPGLLVPGVLHILVERSRWATVSGRAPLAVGSSSAPN